MSGRLRPAVSGGCASSGGWAVGGVVRTRPGSARMRARTSASRSWPGGAPRIVPRRGGPGRDGDQPLMQGGDHVVDAADAHDGRVNHGEGDRGCRRPAIRPCVSPTTHDNSVIGTQMAGSPSSSSRQSLVIIVGVDPHKRIHTASAPEPGTPSGRWRRRAGLVGGTGHHAPLPDGTGRAAKVLRVDLGGTLECVRLLGMVIEREDVRPRSRETPSGFSPRGTPKRSPSDAFPIRGQRTAGVIRNLFPVDWRAYALMVSG